VLQLRSQALPDSAVLQSWVLGYITSVNANVLTINKDVASGKSPDALFSWIDDYCAAHPLDSLARATSGLLDFLRSKHSVQSPPAYCNSKSGTIRQDWPVSLDSVLASASAGGPAVLEAGAAVAAITGCQLGSAL
jgi:hypothetical protein